MTLIIVLLLAGTALVIAEVVFPSFGLFGILAGAAFLVAVLQGFDIDRRTGIATIVGVCVLAPSAFAIGVQVLSRTRFGGKLLMRGGSAPAVGAAGVEYSSLLGREGQVVTPLRPAGTIEIEGRRVDAVSDGTYITAGTLVSVIQVEGSRVVVAAVNGGAAD